MTEKRNPKWQQEVEAILREHLGEDTHPSHIEQMNKLIDLTQKVELPDSDLGMVVAQVLKSASRDLPPLVLAYVGFQVGVAWEKYQNESGFRKP